MLFARRAVREISRTALRVNGRSALSGTARLLCRAVPASAGFNLEVPIFYCFGTVMSLRYGAGILLKSATGRSQRRVKIASAIFGPPPGGLRTDGLLQQPGTAGHRAFTGRGCGSHDCYCSRLCFALGCIVGTSTDTCLKKSVSRETVQASASGRLRPKNFAGCGSADTRADPCLRKWFRKKPSVRRRTAFSRRGAAPTENGGRDCPRSFGVLRNRQPALTSGEGSSIRSQRKLSLRWLRTGMDSGGMVCVCGGV